MIIRSIRSLNFLTLNFISKENKHEMDMQSAYIWTSRTSNVQFSRTFFDFNACDRIVWICISLWVFSYKFLQYFENTFFRRLVYYDFYTFNWQRFHSNYSRFFQRLYPLDVKLAIKCIQTSRKEKFRKQPVAILFKNDRSTRHMFCTIFVSLSVAKILENPVWSSSYLL